MAAQGWGTPGSSGGGGALGCRSCADSIVAERTPGTVLAAPPPRRSPGPHYHRADNPRDNPRQSPADDGVRTDVDPIQ